MMLGWSILVLSVVGALVFALSEGGAGWLDRRGAFGPSREKNEPVARQVLDRRFARGEIDAEEYEAIRARLER